jgi:aminoglycoside phosphotransferase
MGEAASWELRTTGRTDAVVRRSPDGRAYAKTGTGPTREELVNERDRLDWLATTSVPAPRVLDWADDETTATLTTAALPGVPLSELSPALVGRGVESLAAFLTRLHGLPVEACPFDRSLVITMPLAVVRTGEHLVDEDDFDGSRRGRTAHDLLLELTDQRSVAETLELGDLVTCHGDACLPNFLVDPDTGEVTGMVDVGRLGVADRHLDLALTARSLSAVDLNPAFGPATAEALVAAYGRPVDPFRLDFYRLLDEFL